MTEQVETLLKSARGKVYDLKEAGFNRDEAIQAGLKVIADRLVMFPSSTRASSDIPPVKEPDDRPRKIVLEEASEKNTPTTSAPSSDENPERTRKIIL